MRIRIDIKGTNSDRNKRWRGAGMVSGNNSSRLLIDYKADNPQRYYESLEHIFGKNGVRVNHLKLEMGSDINSSSGTEPCVMRYSDEIPDVTRGAGFQLAADVKERYPYVTLDMLYWSEPAWVTHSENVYEARYQWYIKTLIAAYETYGLRFDYVSVSRNERDIEADWIKYIAKKLKEEKDCPYDFSAIKIVAADEENSWRIAGMMADDEELRNAVDIIGSHYTSHSTPEAKLMCDKYGKELWFSEGSPPMSYSEGTARFDGSGLSGINGVLDIANRIIAMYACGKMTLYEYQPVVSAYYDGCTYCHKALIDAPEPWSGYYRLESGYFMSLHFSRFFPEGWQLIDTACFNDSKVGGDGHALIDTLYSFMTACNPETGDYSTVIVNSTDKPVTYEFETDSGNTVNMWETRGPDSGAYDENYFRKTKSIVPVKSDDRFMFTATLKPFSMITVSTLDTVEVSRPDCQTEVFSLPFEDRFDYPEAFIMSRGNAPEYTTDQGGAFEVENGRLIQQITPETKAMEWGATPPPTTCLGDDRWYNYTVSSAVRLVKSSTPDENYIGIGLRYSLACNGVSGYSFMLNESGKWELKRCGEVVLSGEEKTDPYRFSIITLTADENRITASISGKIVGVYNDKMPQGAGRAALYSSYNRNEFDYIKISEIDDKEYGITRIDDTDPAFEYEGDWEHNLMCGFANYKRTVSTGNQGAKVKLTFTGTGAGIFGRNEGESEISVILDGREEKISVSPTGNRDLFINTHGLENNRHELEIIVLSGILTIDGAEIKRTKERT